MVTPTRARSRKRRRRPRSTCTPPRQCSTPLILCFQYREDAERVLTVLSKRFAKYGLTLHPEKTRLLAFGRSALPNSPHAPKPATFDFLGFTHVCARSRRGRFTIHVRTMRKRVRRSVKAVAHWCQQHRHDSVENQAAALNAKLRGHYQYYGRPTNFRALRRFYRLVQLLWHKWLNRRTRGKRLTRARFYELLTRHPLLRPRICHRWTRTGSLA
jgi:RNA-directed DNA polymerase